MSKKVIAILAVLVLLLIGGFFAVKSYLDYQSNQQYLRSSDKVADDLVTKLLSQDVDGAYAMFSSSLRENYSLDYWKNIVFPTFKDYDGGTPKRVASEAVKSDSDTTAPTYEPTLNQEPHRYKYDFPIGPATYEVNFVVFRQNNEWKINELTGAYLP